MAVPYSERAVDAPAAQPATTAAETGTSRVKRGMADMLKGGVIMDVVTAEQARIAEDAGAVVALADGLAGLGYGRQVGEFRQQIGVFGRHDVLQ